MLRMVIGYGRVSTDGQDESRQIDALKEAGCDRTYYVDRASDAILERPELNKSLVGDLRRHKATKWLTLRPMVFHVFAALAEFERDLTRERTTAGLAASTSAAESLDAPGDDAREDPSRSASLR